MRQTLFHIPHKIGAAEIPLLGFGLLLAGWVIFCAVFLIIIGRRNGFNRETWSYLPVMALIGAAFAFVLPAIGDAHGVPVAAMGSSC